MLNLDTHVLIYALTDEITVRERKLLRRSEWAISSIVLWEIAKLRSLGRVEIDLDSMVLGRLLGQIQVLPITLGIAKISTELDFASDPADEIIAATSIAHKIPLLTRDKRILKSKLVAFA